MGDAPVPIPGRVFISYRREETAYPAGWLYDRLAGRYGGQVFKDVDSIQLGDDFVEVITRAVASCDVLLALVGDQWLTITDADGGRRLDNPDDFVRLEIEAALTRNVRVIPILVDGARMPRADELPPSLAGLVRRQALELSPARFDFDTSRLLKVLDRTLVEVLAANDDAAVAAAAAPNAPDQSTTQLPPIQAPRSGAPTMRTDRIFELYDDPEYTAALAAYFTERWDTAVDLMTRVLEKHPDHPQITDRLAEARRQQQLTAWDADARQAAEQGRWAAAVDALERIAAEAPDLADIASRLEHARTEQKIGRLRDDLRRLYTAEQWLAVIAVSEQLAEIDPQLADPDGLVTAAHAALAEAALADRYNTGLQQLDQGDRAAAAATFAAIDAERPGYRDTRALLARAREHPSAPTFTSAPAPSTPAGTPSEPMTEGTPIPVTRLSAEPPHPDAIGTAEVVGAIPTGGRDERRLWMGAGVAIGSAVLIVVGLFLPYQWDTRIVEQDYGSPWYAYALVVAALVTSAGVYMLSGSAGWLSGAGILLGTVAASTWGLAFSVSKLADGGLGVGFWVELIAHLFLVLAAWLTVLALWRSAGVRLVLRPPRGVSGWLVALFGVAGAVTLFFHVVELADTGEFVWFGWWSLAPAVVLTVMALVVPVGAAIAVPRRFGVAVLVGWIGVAASVFLYYVDVLASWYIRGPIVAFGLTLVGLGLAAIPFARAAQTPQEPAERGRDERRLWMGAGVAIGSAVLIVVGLFLPYQWDTRIVEQDYGSPWYAYALVVAALVTSAGVYMLSGSAGWLSGAGILLGTVAASTWGLAFSVSKLADGGLGVGFWVELIAHLFLVLAAWLTVLALWRSAGVRLVLRPPRGVSGWLVALFGVAGAVTLFFHVVELAETGSFVWFGWWSLAPAVVLTVMALVVPVGAAIAVPRRFGVAVLVGWIGVAASVFLYYVDVLASWYIRGPIVAFGLTLVGLGLAAIPFARAAQTPQKPAERPLEALS